MNAGDGGGFEVGDLFADGSALRGLGKNPVERVERKREDQEVKIPTLSRPETGGTRVGTLGYFLAACTAGFSSRS